MCVFVCVRVCMFVCVFVCIRVSVFACPCVFMWYCMYGNDGDCVFVDWWVILCLHVDMFVLGL